MEISKQDFINDFSIKNYSSHLNITVEFYEFWSLLNFQEQIKK